MWQQHAAAPCALHGAVRAGHGVACLSERAAHAPRAAPVNGCLHSACAKRTAPARCAPCRQSAPETPGAAAGLAVVRCASAPWDSTPALLCPAPAAQRQVRARAQRRPVGRAPARPAARSFRHCCAASGAVWRRSRRGAGLPPQRALLAHGPGCSCAPLCQGCRRQVRLVHLAALTAVHRVAVTSVRLAARGHVGSVSLTVWTARMLSIPAQRGRRRHPQGTPAEPLRSWHHALQTCKERRTELAPDCDARQRCHC